MILTPRECAKELRTSLTVIYQLLESGELPAYKLGKNWKIPREALEEYVMRKALFESAERMKNGQ